MSELIVALDLPSQREALTLVDRLDDAVDFYKVGLELYTREGPGVVRELHDRGKRVFLDLKLHDIPNTVAKAVESAAALQVDLLTLHTTGGRTMMAAAAEAAGDHLRLLGVTVLLQLRDQAPGALPPPGVPQADSAEPRQAAPAASSTIGAETENAAGDAPAATRQLLRRAPAAAAAEDALMQAPALEESATPTDALEDSADVADAAVSTAVESITARIDAIETPEEALELISALQAAGRSAEAAEALAAFQARWPGYPLPKALQP